MSANANMDMYLQMAKDAAAKYNVSPSIFASLINSESSFDPTALNSSGAIGIAQFMPATAASMNVDPLNPASALDGAAKYLSQGLKKYGNYQDAISQYKGYGNDLAAGLAKSQAVIDASISNFGGSLSDQIPDSGPSPTPAPAKSPSGNILTWDVNDWKQFLASSAYGFLIGLVGIVLVLGSIWVLITKSPQFKGVK